MTAFDDLERQLRTATERQAVAPKRRRRRFGRGGAIGLLIVGGLGGGAVAADRLLPVGDPVRQPLDGPDPRVGQGVTARSSVGVLPLRVRDPSGGPPWALRVFTTDRGAACVQVGRVSRGRFGVVAPADDPPYREELRTLPAQGGGINTLCSGARADGFPVVRGLRTQERRGGIGSPQRCDGQPCPVRDERIVRYGLLGPQARSATFDDGEGHRQTQAIKPRTGGAYLFVAPGDLAAARAVDEEQRRQAAAFDRALGNARARGLRGSEALKAAGRTSASARRPRPRRAVRRPRDTVTARFGDGTVQQVAGRGRSRRPLPGVKRRSAPVPGAVRAAVTVTPATAGPRDTLELSFRSPVAIGRFDTYYPVRVQGPWSHPRCRYKRYGPAFSTPGNREFTRGELVTFTLRASGQARTWCRGTFDARVTFHSGATGRTEPVVGTARFTIR